MAVAADWLSRDKITRAWRWGIPLIIAIVVLDQLSKAWVLASLPEYTPEPEIEGFWNWYRTNNT